MPASPCHKIVLSRDHTTSLQHTEGRTSTASEKAPRYLVAGFGQSWSFRFEEALKDLAAPE